VVLVLLELTRRLRVRPARIVLVHPVWPDRPLVRLPMWPCVQRVRQRVWQEAPISQLRVQRLSIVSVRLVLFAQRERIEARPVPPWPTRDVFLASQVHRTVPPLMRLLVRHVPLAQREPTRRQYVLSL